VHQFYRIKCPQHPYRARRRPSPSARLHPSSTRPAKNAVVQLAHFNLGPCRRLSPVEDGTCCQVLPGPASTRLLRQQLERLEIRSVMPHWLESASLPQGLFLIPISAAGPASLLALGCVVVAVFFRFPAVFLRLEPPLRLRDARKPPLPYVLCSTSVVCLLRAY
jgi:hypothetical protein